MRERFVKLNSGRYRLQLLIISLLFCSSLIAAPDKVRLRLAWKNQFQFAGYYMAKEKGFFEQEGLDVEILEKDININNVEEVVLGEVDFAIGRSSILINRAQGADIVALLAAFQHSPMMLLTLESTGLSSPGDLRNKRIMFAPDEKHASEIIAMLMKSGIAERDHVHKQHSFNIDDLIKGSTDAIVAYVSNEPYQLKTRNIKYHIIHPKDYGFDFYADILFTSGKAVEERPELVNRFYRASIRGWLYAFDHIHETAAVIYKHYNTQNKSKAALVYEGKVLKEHAFDEFGGFGGIAVHKLKQVTQIYLLANLLDSDVNLKDFIYKPALNRFHLSYKEFEYISTKDKINMCVSKSWMPYEGFIDGEHKGIVADYIKLMQKKIGIPFIAIPTESIQQARDFIQSGKCEIISNIIPTAWGGRYHSYSIPYLSVPLSIASKSGMETEQDIPDSIAVIKESAFEEIVRVRYPEVKVTQVENGMQGMDLIQGGAVKGMMCTDAHISSLMSEHNIKDVVINDFASEEIGISVAVAKDNDLLLGLIDKVIRSITHKERQDIANRWINVKPKPTINPDLLWKIFIGFGVVMVLAVYINWLVIRDNKQLSKIAGTDWLTHLPNRHSIIRKMEGFINHSNRYSRAVSLIYFDIDNFKGINDRFGHHAGDKVLQKLAKLIMSEIRKTDVCGRWGGEEFVLASLEGDVEESVMLAEKLRSKIEVYDFGLPVNVTCSFGVTQYENEEPLEHFVHRADLALYEAKSMGRNTVVAYESR